MICFLFKKRFIFIISLCFSFTVLYSQKAPAASYIWGDVQKTINAVEVFNLHNFPSGNAMLIHDPQNQDVDFVYFNFKPFIDIFALSITSTNPHISEQVVDSVSLKMSNALTLSENMRVKTLNDYLYSLHSNDIEVQQNITPVFKAIYDRDSDFFTNLSEEQTKQLNAVFLAKVTGEQQVQYLFTTNFLLEAIRKSFLPDVQYILSNYHETDLLPPKKNLKSLSFNPLSLSLVTYASLEPEHPFKEEAGKIVRLLADHTDVNNTYNFPLAFYPIVWAVLFGLEEEVKFLHEEKKADLNFHFHNENENWSLYLADYANAVGFIELGQYLKDKGGTSICRQTFLQ